MCNTHSIKETILKGTIVIIEYMAEIFMLKKNFLRNGSVLFLLLLSRCIYQKFLTFNESVRSYHESNTTDVGSRLNIHLTSWIYASHYIFALANISLNCVVHNTNIIYDYNVFTFNCVVEYKRH
jgi:hypothetical protein